MSPKSQWPLVDQWIANYKAHKASIGLAPPSSAVSDAVAQPSGPDGIAYRAQLEDEFDEESLDPDSAMSEEGELDQEHVPWPTLPEVQHQTPSIIALMHMPVHRPFAVLSGILFTPPELGNQPNHDEAAIGYCVGQVADTPCGGCVEGIGPFALCVTVPGFFGNACVGCHWAGSATSCSANVQERACATENDGNDMPESMRVSEQDNMATPTEFVNTKTLENHLASREHSLLKTMDKTGATFEARLTKVESLLKNMGLTHENGAMLTETSLMAGLTKFEDSLLDRMKGEMNGMATVEPTSSYLAKFEAMLMDVKAEQAKVEASVQKTKGKIFSSLGKLGTAKTLKTLLARFKAVLAETQAERTKIAMLHTKLQRVEAIETRCAGLEGLMFDVKAEQETLKQDVALEVDTMKAAIAHSHQESPQMFEVDGNFYLTHPKAVAVMLAAQCILWDLESS